MVGDVPLVSSVGFGRIDFRIEGRLDLETTIAAAFDTFAPSLNGFAASVVRDREVADDLVQESFLRLVVELRAGRRLDNVRAWLFRVCTNLALSHSRRRTVRDRFRSVLVDRQTGPSPEDAAVRRDDDAQLNAALDRLRPEERLGLLLSASGLSAAEVGAAIGRTPNATRAFICRARIHLRVQLSGREESDR